MSAVIKLDLKNDACSTIYDKNSVSPNLNRISNYFKEYVNPSYNEIRGDLGYVFTFKQTIHDKAVVFDGFRRVVGLSQYTRCR